MNEKFKPTEKREQLQRMKSEVCLYLDNHQELFINNPPNRGIDINTGEVLSKFGSHVDTLYKGNIDGLIDDYRLFRLVKAANQFRETDDESEKERIAEEEFVTYMEYLMNIPQDPAEKAIMETVGFQPLDDSTKQRIVGTMSLYFGASNYRPTFSPEYKDQMKKFKVIFLNPVEIGPDSLPFSAEIMETAKVMATFMSVPQDVVREELLNPKIKYQYENMDDPIASGIKQILSRLEERQRQVCILLFGLEDGHSRTIAEAARILGITMDEVRKIEKEMLGSLRSGTTKIDLPKEDLPEES